MVLAITTKVEGAAASVVEYLLVTQEIHLGVDIKNSLSSERQEQLREVLASHARVFTTKQALRI